MPARGGACPQLEGAGHRKGRLPADLELDSHGSFAETSGRLLDEITEGTVSEA